MDLIHQGYGSSSSDGEDARKPAKIAKTSNSVQVNVAPDVSLEVGTRRYRTLCKCCAKENASMADRVRLRFLGPKLCPPYLYQPNRHDTRRQSQL